MEDLSWLRAAIIANYNRAAPSKRKLMWGQPLGADLYPRCSKHSPSGCSLGHNLPHMQDGIVYDGDGGLAQLQTQLRVGLQQVCDPASALCK